MAIYSMTGFARVQARASIGGEEQLSYTLTVKSVNHRFLDLQFRLPPASTCWKSSCAVCSRRISSASRRSHSLGR